MADDFAAMVAEAEARGRQALANEPRAASARYDAKSGRVYVKLTNGCGFASPTCLAREGAVGETAPAQAGMFQGR